MRGGVRDACALHARRATLVPRDGLRLHRERRGARHAQRKSVRRVARFVEKPDRARAEQFLASGRFFWNAGIFVWRTDAILAALEQHAREIVGPVRTIRSEADAERVYPTLPSAPIDVAVMEKAGNVRVLPSTSRGATSARGPRCRTCSRRTRRATSRRVVPACSRTTRRAASCTGRRASSWRS
ncbi:MAG: hypothetical protein IPJ77_01395 [Planctomycetes bacterium]|nr:hypothetical protein [Planctomycetota bacterium]